MVENRVISKIDCFLYTRGIIYYIGIISVVYLDVNLITIL